MSKILIIVVLLLLILFQKNCYYGLIKFKNSANKLFYLNNTEQMESKTRSLDIMKERVDILVDKLKQSPYKNKITVKRLINKWNGNLNEIEATFKRNQILGYNINKGESIHVCLQDPNSNELIKDYNTMFFIVLHELAHIMTFNYKHNAEFWDNFAFLIRFSNQLGLYEYVNYNKTPVNFCGGVVDSTPYKKSKKNKGVSIL